MNVNELAEIIRTAGTPVRLCVTGEAATLTPAAALTVYRIIQEALTNVVRHAPRAEADVLVRLGASGAHIQVTDNGPGGSSAPASTGPVAHHGIVGMRERARGVRRDPGRGTAPQWRLRRDRFPAGQRPGRRAGGMTIGVVVADDEAMVRAGFRLLIDAEPGLTVLGESANGAEAVALADKTSPNVVLMDIRMPVLDGIEATRQITSAGRARVLVLTTFDLDEYVFAALRADASGFLLKDRPPEELLSAIRVIAAGRLS